MDASYAQNSFLGGEWSKRAQGRYDLPTYRTAMNVCLNSLPIEAGAWTRRSGTRHIAVSRSAQHAKVLKFDFQQSSPYNIVITNGFMRFTTGPSLVMTNDAVAVSAISTANPAVVTTASAHGWSTADQVMFNSFGVNNPLLHNRQFSITKTASDKFSLADAVTGDSIDGSTLGTFVSGNVTRIMEIAAPYTTAVLETIRSIQATLPASSSSSAPASTAVLLQGSVKPQVLATVTAPTDTAFATFSLTPANFIDGPYLDPVPGGATVTPSATTGVIPLTISFPTWSSTKVYSKGDFVVYSSINYQSLTDQNVNLQPDTHTSNWKAVSAGVAIGGNGFVGTDVGRSIRLFSEPDLWASGTAYTTGNIVTYNNVYYTAIASTTGNQPDTSPTKWTVNASAAVWSWGRITAITNSISGTLSGSTNIGDMTSNGGLAAAFDGTVSKVLANACEGLGTQNAGTFISYVGKNYSGASAQTISFAVVYPPTNSPFCQANLSGNIGPITITFNLRAKHTAPSSSSDGTLLGSLGPMALSSNPQTILSNDTTTAWEYVWIEMTSFTANGFLNPADRLLNSFAQVQFFNPASTGSSSNSISIQLLGSDLKYTTPIRTWRLGAFSDTTGWPTCGCYHEGRVWLSGAIPNRIDGSVSNGQSLITPEKIDFSPTGSTGAVADSNAISYTFNSKDTNPIRWMEPDQQGIICGTQAGEWLVQASALNAPLTPTSIQAHRVTKIGCANIEPKRSEHTLLFVQAHRRKVMEYFADVFSGKFSAPNLSEKAKHLTIPNVAEIAYQQELAPVVWARCDDGSLIGCTYKRETLASSQGPTFAGWHRHTLGSGFLVESISVGPSENGDLDGLTMVTYDSSTLIHHLELMQDLFDEGASLADGWFLDDAITPSFSQDVTVAGVPCRQLGGLWHLNGRSVTAFIGGLDCGDYTVASGIINVPYNTANVLFTPSFVSGYSGTLPIVVGFTYTSDGQLVRPATPQESGARNGPALGKYRRTQAYSMLLEGTSPGLQVGTAFTASRLTTAKLQSDGGTPLTVQQMKTGVHWDQIKDESSWDSMLCWRVTRPFPATIAAAQGFIHTQDQ